MGGWKTERVMGPWEPVVVCSEWEIWWVESISSTLGASWDRRAGIMDGVMMAGSFIGLFARAVASSWSYGGRGKFAIARGIVMCKCCRRVYPKDLERAFCSVIPSAT